MILCFISDTHCQHSSRKLEFCLDRILEKYPDSTIVHCGDISSRGRFSEVEDFLAWYSSLGFKNRIMIPGNHDFFFDYDRKAITDMGRARHGNPMYSEQDVSALLSKYPNIIYLNDSGITLEGVNFWGSPITPWFHDWAFNRTDETIGDHWKMIPENTNVLITHGPPRGILDLTYNGYTNVGCMELAGKTFDLKDLMVHSFGHIHESFGIEVIDSVTYINASFLDFNYRPLNSPVIFDTESKKAHVFSIQD